MGYKDREKELKAPDEFQKIGAQAVPWIESHGKTVVTGVFIALGAFGAVSLFNHLSKRGEEEASQGFGAALKVLSRDVNPNPSPEAKPGDEPPFKTEREKDEALIAQLTDFRAKNAGRKAAAAAGLPLAQALLRVGKATEALPALEDYLKNADLTDPMRPAGFEARGYAFESQQKYDEAMAAFDQLAKETRGEYLKGMGLYHRARMLALKGDKQGAARQFQDVDKNAPESAAARLSKDRLALLISEGVMITEVSAPPPAGVDAGQ